jgi:hypothetical protein
VIIPLVMAQRVKLHPALIAIGVVVVGQLLGVIGLFVAVPIISAAVILVDELWVKLNERDRGIKAASPLDDVGEAAGDGEGSTRPQSVETARSIQAP